MSLFYIRFLVFVLATNTLIIGCDSSSDIYYPFYEFTKNTNGGAVENGGAVDTLDTASYEDDSDECSDTAIDDEGRCIFYVNWQAGQGKCGTSWDNAFTQLQDGIDAAWAASALHGSCSVWVAQGTYISFENDSDDSFKMRTNVNIYGGFAGNEYWLKERDVVQNTTVLEGKSATLNEHSYHVVKGADNSRLDGFIIQNGKATSNAPNNRGGGLLSKLASIVIDNCNFRNNSAIEGGAVFLYEGSPEITNTTFVNNHANKGGAVYVLNSFAKLDNNKIQHNSSDMEGGAIYFERKMGNCQCGLSNTIISKNRSSGEGGGIYISKCDVSIENSDILENTTDKSGGAIAGFLGSVFLNNVNVHNNTAMFDGGGLYLRSTKSNLDNCSVTGNLCDGNGGGMYLYFTKGVFNSVTFSSNVAKGNGGGIFVKTDRTNFIYALITGNSALNGGGIYNAERSNATIVNSVFVQNKTIKNGGGVYNHYLSEIIVFNSIFWKNLATEIYNEQGAVTKISNCDILNGHLGISIFSAEPLFLDLGYWDDNGTVFDTSDDIWNQGDYHLQSTSPCIDMANETMAPTEDAGGNLWQDIINIGILNVSADLGLYDSSSS